MSLISKTKNSKSISEFHLLSLYHVVMKIMTKVIANCLKGILGAVID